MTRFPQFRLLIEGIGGIGGVLAAGAIDAGYSPVLITGNAEITRAIAEQGLRVRTPERELRLPAEAHTDLDELDPAARFDASWLVMKATSVCEAARRTCAHLAPEGYLVTFQNGIVEDAVGEIVGRERVVAGIVGWGGTMHAPGCYERTSGGKTLIGELDGHTSLRVERLATILLATGPVEISGNIRGALWSKLAINCTITTLGAITGDTLGEMLEDRRLRRVFLRTYAEVIDTAEAAGIELERIAAHPKLLYLPRGAGRLRRSVKDLLVRAVARKYGRIRSSMLQSLERGRPTEIGFLNGYVVERAAEVGVPTPINAALVRQIREIERGLRPVARSNVEELLAAG